MGAVVDAEKEFAEMQEKVDATQKKLLEDFGKIRDKVELAKKQSEQAAEAEKKAKVKVESCEKALAKVKKYIEACKAWEDKITKLFDEMDIDKSGTVSHIEFKKYMNAKDPTVRLQLGVGHW